MLSGTPPPVHAQGGEPVAPALPRCTPDSADVKFGRHLPPTILPNPAQLVRRLGEDDRWQNSAKAVQGRLSDIGRIPSLGPSSVESGPNPLQCSGQPRRPRPDVIVYRLGLGDLARFGPDSGFNLSASQEFAEAALWKNDGPIHHSPLEQMFIKSARRWTNSARLRSLGPCVVMAAALEKAMMAAPRSKVAPQKSISKVVLQLPANIRLKFGQFWPIWAVFPTPHARHNAYR